MAENLLANAESSLAKVPKENAEDIAKNILTIAYYKQELQKFEDDIAEQRRQFFQFSIEELFYMYGQFDNFVGIEFHKFSEAARKFGRDIGGIFVYGKNERTNLESIIQSDNIPRTNGLVKIDVSSNYNLTEEQIRELIEVGFNSGDIHKILASNTQLVNSYAQTGKKEIPNTININFDPTGTDPSKLALYILNMRLNNSETLIENDWNKYYGYTIYYSPELKEVEYIKSKIYNEDGSQKKEVRFYELVAKNTNSDIREKELNELSALLKNRRLERFEILKNELRKNNINSIEQLKIEHPEIYSEIYKTALVFDDEVLTVGNLPIPIYWDFKSYLHIYLRHCEKLQSDGHFKAKTPFAYTQKDIRRILKIAVEKLISKIQNRLSQGLDFRTYGEKALYFNGNYYSMRIESNGRIDSFHPNEYK
jgi:hypothetical protein